LANLALAIRSWLTAFLCTVKTIKDTKFDKNEHRAFFDYLNKYKTYIEVNSLGYYDATRVIGYLLKLHPNVMH